MNSFRLDIKTCRSDKRFIPILSRDYKTVLMKHCKLNYFNQLMLLMLKHSSHNVIDL